MLGRAWKDAGLKREDIFLQTKFGINIDFSDPNNVHATRYDFSAKHLITRLDEELEALGTDYVDFALLHRPDTLMEAEEIVEAFTTLHKAGKVRHFGVSNVNPWQAERLQSWLGDDPAMPGWSCGAVASRTAGRPNGWPRPCLRRRSWSSARR